MGVKILIYSVFCFAKFIVAFSILLAVAVPRQSQIENAQTNSTCQICYNRSLADSDTLYEFGVCHDKYIDERGSNLFVNKGYWDTSSDPGSTVRTYVWVTAVLFVLAFIGCCGFLALGYISRDESDQEGLPYLIQFVKINFYESMGVMMLANSVWNLYDYNGCWVSPVGKPYIVGQSVLLYIYIAFAILESFCKGGIKALTVLLSVLVLFGYAILSITIAAITFSKSRDPASLILVVLAFASIFEVPSALFGYSVVTSFLRRVGVGHIEFT